MLSSIAASLIKEFGKRLLSLSLANCGLTDFRSWRRAKLGPEAFSQRFDNFNHAAHRLGFFRLAQLRQRFLFLTGEPLLLLHGLIP